MPDKFEIVAVARMNEPNVSYHLIPIAMNESISLLHIVRPLPPLSKLPVDKSRYYEIKGKTIIHRLVKVFLKAITLGKDKNVKCFVSFFAFPYGFIALFAGFVTRKPVHIGFVGSDWYRYGHSWYSPILNFIIQKANLFTVPGEKIKNELIAKGYSPDKIFYLPHAIPFEKTIDKCPEDRAYDCIFVGRIIPVKRIDLILSAISIVKKTFPNISVCIIGEGPLRTDMELLSNHLNLKANISFTGYQDNPHTFFQDSRIVLISSEWEGIPFTIIEGMAAGAVPVSTSVGAIPDVVEHEKTGLLVPPGEPKPLADAIIRLLKDKHLYNTIRSNLFQKREDFRFEKVAEKWSEWISLMCD